MQRTYITSLITSLKVTNSSEQVELQQLTNGLLREQVDTVYIVPLHGLQKSLAFNAS